MMKPLDFRMRMPHWRPPHPNLIWLALWVAFAPTARAIDSPFLVFGDGFEDGNGCAWSSSGSAENCPPTAPAVVWIVALDTDTVALDWLPSVDDQTASASLIYRIHLANDPEFVPGPGTLATSVSGGTMVQLAGLDPATTYYVRVLAEDGDGLASPDTKLHQITTLEISPVLDSGVTFERAEDLGLDPPTSHDASTLVFADGPSATPPTVGAILIGPYGDGSGYLRHVENAVVGGGEITVDTTDSSLDALLEQGQVASTGTLEEAGADPPALWGAPLTFRRERETASDGSRVDRAIWGDRRLVLEETRYAGQRGALRYAPGPGPGSSLLELSSGAGELKVEPVVEFKPDLVTDAKITLASGLESADLRAIGKFTVGVRASYEFSAAAEFQPDPVTIFTKTWTSIYEIPTVPPIPVFQQITLSLEAQVSASVSAAITATAEATANATVEVGVTYDSVSGWQPVSSLTTSRTLEASLDVVGGAQAEIRLIPKLTIEFYKVIAGRISVEPYVNGVLAAEGTLDPLCLPLELTQFDVGLGLDCNVGIDFTGFSEPTPLYETKVCDPTWPLFNLPQVELSSSGGGPVDVTAHVTDGLNDPWSAASGLWDVSPATATVTPKPGNPLLATLVCSAEDTYTISYGGNGVLGPLGRQCAQLDVPCVPGPPEFTVYLPGGVPLTMVPVPAGTFLMGSPDTEVGRGSYEDLHQVTLSQGYFLGKYEVTQEQWEALMGVNPADPGDSDTLDCHEGGDWGVGPEHPVFCVSWDDITGVGGFLDQLNAYLTKTGQMGAGQFRLPTESEWEKGARAGTQTRFSHGDVLECPVDDCSFCAAHDPFLWWCGNNQDGARAVGSKLPNAYGLYDVHGNIWEWVSDWYGLYPEGPVTDPVGPDHGLAKAVRSGGSAETKWDRSAERLYWEPAVRRFSLGFRLALTQ